MRPAITISLVEEATGGPFVFWHDLPQACKTAAELGFRAVEIFPPSAEALNGAAETAKSHGLDIAAIGTGAGWVKHKLRMTDPDSTVRDRAIEFISALITKASASNSSVIVGSMQGRWGDGVEREQATEWLGTALTELSRRAGDNGIKLFYEPLNRYETNLFNQQEDAARFIQTLNLGNVKVLCDLYHMNIEEANLGASLRAVGSMVGHVHFADSNRQAIGMGHINMAEVSEALYAIRYDGYVSAECLPLPNSNTAAEKTMESFRKWFN